MTKETSEKPPARGYGNIYTPHAGSMIIHVQRESGLANRTIILTQRQVRLLRRGSYALGATLLVILVSWFFLAAQAARVPQLTHRVQNLQRDVTRLDTLQAALTALESRFQQVQHMLGASTPNTPATSPSADPTNTRAHSDPTEDSTPSQWPLDVAGTIVSHSDSSASASGLDIEIPTGTAVHAAGSGAVEDVTVDTTGAASIRIRHGDGYETIYANARNVRVTRGTHVAAGAIIAVSGGASAALPPHIHFDVRRNGASVDPMSLMKQGPSNGDLQ